MHIDIDPVIFALGPLQVRWYGLMYVIGFVIGTKIVAHVFKTKFVDLPPEKADSFITHILIFMFIFARLFYVFIYNLEDTHSLLDVIAVWRGGLSFHGAAFGFAVAAWVFAKKNNLKFFAAADAMVLGAPQGIFWGRMGNFINGELYGRATDVPWAMTFASDPQRIPRHPSQLYEAVGEGIILMAMVWFIKGRVKRYGIIAPSFLIGYGVVRYFIEFFRQPDVQMGYYFGGTTTMGQILCFLMIIAGVAMIARNIKRKDLLINNNN